MKKYTKKLTIFLVFLFVFFTSGCTVIYPVPDVSLKNQGGDYFVDKKLDLKINLCLNDELYSSKYERSSMGDTYLVKIGDQLAKNSVELSELVFKSVQVTKKPMDGGDGNIDAILTPRVAAIERTLGSLAWHESIFTIVMEWKLESADNKIIWIDSIKGEGREESGNTFNHKTKMKQQIEKLLNDLFSKSFYAIKESPEIGKFIARK